MQEFNNIYPDNKQDMYHLLKIQIQTMLEGEKDVIANLSNCSALLNEALTDINWIGFYLMKQGELILGPFQGKLACIHIPVGKGVCGTAVEKKEIQLVKDVHEFPGHIACDSASQSEVVIPMMLKDKVIGVLDIDSPSIARFDEEDAKELEEIVQLIIEGCSWESEIRYDFSGVNM